MFNGDLFSFGLKLLTFVSWEKFSCIKFAVKVNWLTRNLFMCTNRINYA